VQTRTARFQTVVTAVISKRHVIDGLEVVGQAPKALKAEMASVEATSKASDEQMEEARQRVLELWHHRQHRFEDRKRTARAWEIVQPREEAGPFPQAHEACDTGVLNRELTRDIESRHNHGVRALECSRHMQWYGQWRRVDVVAAALKHDHPERLRPVSVPCRNGEKTSFWAVTKTVRVKRDGRMRWVMVHEKQDLTAIPRFLVTDAWQWEHGRVLETWSDRWAAAIFHEFGQQVTGLEAAQVRKAEAVTRHLRLRGVAQSMVQRAPACASTSASYAFAEGQITYGQTCRAIGREVLRSLLELSKPLVAAGKACDAV
jgi:hypothetical protein